MASVELQPGVVKRFVIQPKPRYPIARVGGNWQGLQYLSQVEHDRCVRAGIDAVTAFTGRLWASRKLRRKVRDEAYRAEMEKIIASR